MDFCTISLSVSDNNSTLKEEVLRCYSVEHLSSSLFSVCAFSQALLKVNHDSMIDTVHRYAQSPLILECEDFSADSNDCTKFFRCFKNIRIRFTCPPDSAWEESLTTCVGKNLVEACRQVKLPRRLGKFISLYNAK